jgi:hypothetical protein
VTLAEFLLARVVEGDPAEAERDATAYFAAYPAESLRSLALSYAEHPDYREEWRP